MSHRLLHALDAARFSPDKATVLELSVTRSANIAYGFLKRFRSVFGDDVFWVGPPIGERHNPLSEKQDKTIQEVELLVFLRPTVVRDAQQSKALLDDATRRMPLTDKWEDDAKAKGKPGEKTPPVKAE